MQIPGTIIRINRMDQAIKLTALAYQCHISASYLSQIETGKAQPDPQILQLLAKALDLDYTTDQAWLIPAKQKLEHFVRNALFWIWRRRRNRRRLYAESGNGISIRLWPSIIIWPFLFMHS